MYLCSRNKTNIQPSRNTAIGNTMVTIDAIIKSDHLMSEVLAKYNNVLSTCFEFEAYAMELSGRLHISCHDEKGYDNVRSLLLTTNHIAHCHKIEIEIVEILYFKNEEE